MNLQWFNPKTFFHNKTFIGRNFHSWETVYFFLFCYFALLNIGPLFSDFLPLKILQIIEGEMQSTGRILIRRATVIQWLPSKEDILQLCPVECLCWHYLHSHQLASFFSCFSAEYSLCRILGVYSTLGQKLVELLYPPTVRLTMVLFCYFAILCPGFR